MAAVDYSVSVSRAGRLREPRKRPVPDVLRRHREARLELNPRKAPFAPDRFAHLKLSHD